MVARRVEQISTMRRVDVKEDTRDDDCLLFKKFFEEGLGNVPLAPLYLHNFHNKIENRGRERIMKYVRDRC